MSDTAGLIASGAEALLIHLAEILEGSSDYVATSDLYGQILYANRAVSRTLRDAYHRRHRVGEL